MDPTTNTNDRDSQSIYERERREKLQKIRDLGLDPFGARTEAVRPLSAIRDLHKAEFGQDGGPVVKGAGRVMLARDMGKLMFITLRDETGDLQVALDKRRVNDQDWQLARLVDLGDQIVVEGPLGATKKGEITVWATNVTMAAKSLLPPPAKWEGLSDVETRYRQRYVDLWANPQVMQTLKLRMRIVDEVRQFMRMEGFVEVETPMMQPMHGGAAARPFVTKHNALGIDLYMRIAPELYLKRLLVGGFSKVFELNRNFRNEGISPRHNPEFTMLEAYEAYGNFETMSELVEKMICAIAQNVFGTLKIEHENAEGVAVKTINLEGDTSQPHGRRWRRVRMGDLVAERTGWKFEKKSIEEDPFSLEQVCLLRARQLHMTAVEWMELYRDSDPQFSATMERVSKKILPGGQYFDDAKSKFAAELSRKSPAEQLVEVYEKLIEPTLIDPTFVTHVPSVIIPLARKNKDDDFYADVYELAINGQEISPGYTELNDPDVQAANFAHQVGDKEEQQKVDEDFLTALRYGMPPAGGIGLGIDRLVMMLTGAESIRDVILFPLMKPREETPKVDAPV